MWECLFPQIFIINKHFDHCKVLFEQWYVDHLLQRTVIGKDPDAGKDWRQEEKGTTENEVVGWHHQLDGHEFE